MAGLAKVEVRGVTKVFGEGDKAVQALHGVSFSVQAGSFTALLGPSGCGKSTLFNMIAGLLCPTCGDVLMDGESVVGKPGRVGYMLQKDLLLPWRTITENVILGQTLRHVPKKAAVAKAQPLMERYGLHGFEHMRPGQLSGGMRQRAALLRTWLTEREVLLLDEPFGALDALTRLQLQMGLTQMWQEHGKTILLVTHDVDEALLLSDEILVLSRRPGTLRTRLTVSLPRPRTPEVLASAEVLGMKRTLMDLLLHEEGTV